MKERKIFRRVVAGAVALGAALALMLGSTTVAFAAPPGTLGTLTLTPSVGADTTAPSVRTSAGCSANADGYNAVVTGPGAFASGFFIVGTTSANFSTSGPIDSAFGLNMRDAASQLGTTIVPGEYVVTLNCVDSFLGDTKGTFVGSMYFTSPTRYQTTDPAAPITTSTTLSVSPASPVTQGTAVTLTATVTPASATGTVQFTDNGANLGAPVPVSGGTATFNAAGLAPGAHAFTARFVPANPAAYTASESAPVSLQVTPFSGATATETISTTVNAGALVISVANQGVTLPSPTLLPDSSLLTSGGAINPVTVTDTRAGNPGWSCSGQVTDFSDGASSAINGGNLGWTPKLVDKGTSQTIAPGPAVPPAPGIAPGATPPPGQGLSSSRTLATAADGAGLGTANLGADLALNVPTSTKAGTYSSTLTLTVI